jgi:hypothetical protein
MDIRVLRLIMDAYLRSYRLLNCRVGLVVAGAVQGVLYMVHLTRIRNINMAKPLVVTVH